MIVITHNSSASKKKWKTTIGDHLSSDQSRDDGVGISNEYVENKRVYAKRKISKKRRSSYCDMCDMCVSKRYAYTGVGFELAAACMSHASQALALW